MSKAILVLDEMPESCEECLYSGDYDKARNLAYCRIEDQYMHTDTGITLYCPLKEIPYAMNVHDCNTDGIDDFAMGWNACLEAITGDGSEDE